MSDDLIQRPTHADVGMQCDAALDAAAEIECLRRELKVARAWRDTFELGLFL